MGDFLCHADIGTHIKYFNYDQTWPEWPREIIREGRKMVRTASYTWIFFLKIKSFGVIDDHQQFVHLVSGFQRFLEVFGFRET